MELLEERFGQPLLMTYRAVGSSTGLAEFLAGASDFGASEIPLSPAQRDAFGQETLHIPHVLGAIGFFHKVPLSTNGGKEIELTAELLARIFSRDIKTWDHPDILAANANLKVPKAQAITVVHRVLGSSSTSLISEYFELLAKPHWPLGVGSILAWPADTVGSQGSGGVSDSISATPYSIGYVDSDHAHRLGLTEIALKNKDGVFLVSSDADIGASADSANLPKSHEDWSKVTLLNQAGPKTWPIVSFSYMIIKSNMSSFGESGALVQSYLKFVQTPEAQGMVQAFGFDPIPQKVINLNNEGIKRITLANDIAQFTFETGTDSNPNHSNNNK